MRPRVRSVVLTAAGIVLGWSVGRLFLAAESPHRAPDVASAREEVAVFAPPARARTVVIKRGPRPSRTVVPPTTLVGDARASSTEAARTVWLIASQHPGTSVVSIDCDQEPCGAVLEARDLRVLRALVLDVNAAFGGHIDLEVHDRARDGAEEGGAPRFEAAVAVGTSGVESVSTIDAEF